MRLLEELRYALRSLRKSPGFSAVAVATLALGIGANTAIFSVVRGVLLKPLPYPGADRIVALGTDAGPARPMGAASFPDMEDWRARSTVFEEVGATYPMDLAVSGGLHPEHVDAAAVTAGLLKVLGARPEAGRLFTADDDRPGTRNVIVSDEFWRSVLGARPDVVGAPIRLNGRAFTVVGVLPPGFRLPIGGSAARLWLSAAFAHEPGDGGRAPADVRSAHFVDVFANLKAGVPISRARGEMNAIAAQLRNEYPDTNGNLGVRVVSAAEPLVRRARPALAMLLAAVGLVLLIACANAANLVLARATTRRAEITLDGGVLLFALALSLATGILFGLAPALTSARPNLAEALRERGSTPGGDRHRLRSGLVIGEVAVAFVLLAGAGLLLRSLSRLLRVDPGFDARGVFTARLDLPSLRYPDAGRAGAAYADIVDDLSRAPGIASAGAVMPLPLSGFENMVGFALEPGSGTASPAGRSPRTFPWEAAFGAAEPGYFRTLGVALRAGREFARSDGIHAPPVAVVNEALARKYFAEGNALGKRIRPSVSAGDDPPAFREIVGIVADVKLDGLRADPRPTVYVPEAQVWFSSMRLVVKTSGDDAAAIASVRRLVGRLDRDLPVYGAQPLSRYVSDSVSSERFTSLVVVLFAGTALVLTAIGLFGVISFAVAQRTREIGIRMAIGARPGEVFHMVIAAGMRLVAVGAAAGLAGALLLGRTLQAFLFGIGGSDPATLGAVAALLVAVGVCACAIPARCAIGVDPIVALREE